MAPSSRATRETLIPPPPASSRAAVQRSLCSGRTLSVVVETSMDGLRVRVRTRGLEEVGAKVTQTLGRARLDASARPPWSPRRCAVAGWDRTLWRGDRPCGISFETCGADLGT